MTFGAPEWLWGLLLIPFLIALFVRAERLGLRRLQEFVSARLLPQLAGTVNRPRRIAKFGLQLLGLSLVVVSLAQPRWGYTFQDVKRKGLDLLIAVDTSRSMLSNDVQPNRLERVKLAVQDLINELQGDRVGLIAFAGRAFLQAPLTIDYDAVVEAINDLDTKTIPEGGTNISSAITLATQSFGKSATGNRALIIFTDGEELSGDAVKMAKDAADAGVRIFTVGVGTPQGSLIPITGDDGQTAFVKDSAGQVVKSKLDDKRLREIAQATGGFYIHLESGPRTMQQVQSEGLTKMQAAEMDVRLSRRPIERYEWPLGAALIALALSILIPERRRMRERGYVPAAARTAGATAALLMFSSFALGAAPGIDAYRDGKFEDAYGQFQQTLKSHPESRAEDKLQFDSGAAAYKLKDYNRALESFSQALLTRDTGLQSKGHYNLGNTLYQRGETEKSDDKKLSDWTDALDHYEQTLKLDPQDKDAKDNYEYVKKKIEELKNKKSQQQPSPSPSPPQKNKQNQQQNKQDQQQNQDQQQQKQSQQNQQQQKDQQQQQQNQQQNQQQQQGQSEQEKKDQQQQSQDQQSQNESANDKEQKQNDQAQAKNQPQKKQQQQPGESPSPSPSPGAEKQQANQPSPSPGERQAEESPSPGEGENETPSPSPGEGEGEGAESSATPAESPQKKFAGEVKGAGEDKSQKPPDKSAQIAEAELEKEGQMNERQALALLESMKDEEARVRLDERRVKRHVYNDW